MNLTSVHVRVCDSSFVQGNKSCCKIVDRQILGRTCSLRAQRSCFPPKVSLWTVVVRVSSQGCCHEAQTGALLARGRLSSCAHPDAVMLPACLQGWRAGINSALGESKNEKHCRSAKCATGWMGKLCVYCGETLFPHSFQSLVLTKGKKKSKKKKLQHSRLHRVEGGVTGM